VSVARRTAFTLIEVILASMIASGGVIALYGGVSTCVQSEERRMFYDACSGFLESDLEFIVRSGIGFGASARPIQGTIRAEGPPVGYKITATPYTDPSPDGVQRVQQVTVAFTGTIGSRAVSETVITYLHPDLRAERKTEQAASPSPAPSPSPGPGGP
jgi:hypothetical protein